MVDSLTLAARALGELHASTKPTVGTLPPASFGLPIDLGDGLHLGILEIEASGGAMIPGDTHTRPITIAIETRSNASETWHEAASLTLTPSGHRASARDVAKLSRFVRMCARPHRSHGPDFVVLGAFYGA